MQNFKKVNKNRSNNTADSNTQLYVNIMHYSALTRSRVIRTRIRTSVRTNGRPRP